MEAVNQYRSLTLSIVCATIDDFALVRQSIASIEEAAICGDIGVQVIVVDQTLNRESEVLVGCFDEIELVYIHSQIRGLAVSRNVGLNKATGQLIMFWDADCLMDKGFFQELRKALSTQPGAQLIYGAVKSPVTGANVFRDWPRRTANVSQFKKWQMSTSVNCIWRNRLTNSGVRMDERFGIGSTYGSCEDVDFFLSLRGPAVYFPGIIVYHPDQHVQEVPFMKSKSYSFGFGALCRKHALQYGVLYLILTTVKKLYEVARGHVRLSTALALVRERIRGYLAFG